MNDSDGGESRDGDYYCHILILSRNYLKSKVFFVNVLRWKVEEQTGTNTLEALSVGMRPYVGAVREWERICLEQGNSKVRFHTVSNSVSSFLMLSSMLFSDSISRVPL